MYVYMLEKELYVVKITYIIYIYIYIYIYKTYMIRFQYTYDVVYVYIYILVRHVKVDVTNKIPNHLIHNRKQIYKTFLYFLVMVHFEAGIPKYFCTGYNT